MTQPGQSALPENLAGLAAGQSFRGEDRRGQMVTGWLHENRSQLYVSPQTIYDWIYRHRRNLKQYLHCQKGNYRRTRADRIRKAARAEAAAARHISKRPKAVEKRKTIGHWEGDTIHGAARSGCIATFVERKGGFLVARVLSKENFGTGGFAAAGASLGALKPRQRRTMTLDNGPEMKFAERIEADLNLKVYYATPYHSWERGSNENTNGLLRFFFPKKTRSTGLTQKELDQAVELINNRPRKRLNWRTPAQILKR